MVHVGLLLRSENKKMPIFKIMLHLNNSSLSKLQRKINVFLSNQGRIFEILGRLKNAHLVNIKHWVGRKTFEIVTPEIKYIKFANMIILPN